MPGVWFACALCACSKVYDLEATHLDVDAVQHGCPAIGSDPTYSKYLAQAVLADCGEFDLSPSRGRAIGACRQAEEPVYSWYEVLPDGTLATAVGLPQAHSDTTLTVAYFGARLLDDQRVALIEVSFMPAGSITQRTIVYRRGDDAIWRFEELLPFGTTVGQLIGTFSANEHVFLSKPPAAEEWARRNGTWEKLQTLGEAELGVQSSGGHSLSADGLRLMFFTGSAVAMYTDRPSIDAPFRPASGPITALPAAFAAMTGDCERVYFSGLQTIFYAERI